MQSLTSSFSFRQLVFGKAKQQDPTHSRDTTNNVRTINLPNDSTDGFSLKSNDSFKSSDYDTDAGVIDTQHFVELEYDPSQITYHTYIANQNQNSHQLKDNIKPRISYSKSQYDNANKMDCTSYQNHFYMTDKQYSTTFNNVLRDFEVLDNLDDGIEVVKVNSNSPFKEVSLDSTPASAVSSVFSNQQVKTPETPVSSRFFEAHDEKKDLKLESKKTKKTKQHERKSSKGQEFMRALTRTFSSSSISSTISTFSSSSITSPAVMDYTRTLPKSSRTLKASKITNKSTKLESQKASETDKTRMSQTSNKLKKRFSISSFSDNKISTQKSNQQKKAQAPLKVKLPPSELVNKRSMPLLRRGDAPQKLRMMSVRSVSNLQNVTISEQDEFHPLPNKNLQMFSSIEDTITVDGADGDIDYQIFKRIYMR